MAAYERINPKEVAAEFKRKKALPGTGAFHGMLVAGGSRISSPFEPSPAQETSEGKAYCGLGIMGINDVSDSSGVLSKYRTGFVQGFDGVSPSACCASLYGDTYIQGYVDGVESHRLALIAVGELDDAP